MQISVSPPAQPMGRGHTTRSRPTKNGTLASAIGTEASSTRLRKNMVNTGERAKRNEKDRWESADSGKDHNARGGEERTKRAPGEGTNEWQKAGRKAKGAGDDGRRQRRSRGSYI